MPIYPEKSAPFNCAICHRSQPPRWESPQLTARAPLCWRCEQEYGTGAYGDANPDRRIIKQLSALVCALEIDAHRIQIGEGPIYG